MLTSVDTSPIWSVEPCTGRKYQAWPEKGSARPGTLQKNTGPAQWLKSLAQPDPYFWACCWQKLKHNSAICMLNIINSPIWEARVRSGDGVIDSLHLRGRKKGWSAAKGKDADHRSVACERAGQLHGRNADRPGPARPCNFWVRPDGFSKL